jgi:hypothetical protein
MKSVKSEIEAPNGASCNSFFGTAVDWDMVDEVYSEVQASVALLTDEFIHAIKGDEQL